MSDNTANKIKLYIQVTMIVIVLLLFILTAFLIKEYVDLHQMQILNGQEFRPSNFFKNHGPLTANDVGAMRPWMTFDYINKLFNLPPDYLKNILSVSDPAYPKVSLNGYANNQHINITDFMEKVENSIRDYLIASGNH